MAKTICQGGGGGHVPQLPPPPPPPGSAKEQRHYLEINHNSLADEIPLYQCGTLSMHVLAELCAKSTTINARQILSCLQYVENTMHSKSLLL